MLFKDGVAIMKALSIFFYCYSLISFPLFGLADNPRGTASIAIEVTDQSGAAIQGADVRVVASSKDPSSNTPTREVQTNAEGKAALKVAVGEYEVVVAAQGFRASSRRVAVTGSTTETIKMTVELSIGVCSPCVEIEPLPPESAYITVEVSDSTGARVPRAQVEVRPQRPEQMRQTDEYGTVTLKLIPGKYQLFVTARGFKPWDREFQVREGKNDTMHVTLEAANNSQIVTECGGRNCLPVDTTTTEVNHGLVLSLKQERFWESSSEAAQSWRDSFKKCVKNNPTLGCVPLTLTVTNSGTENLLVWFQTCETRYSFDIKSPDGTWQGFHPVGIMACSRNVLTAGSLPPGEQHSVTTSLAAESLVENAPNNGFLQPRNFPQEILTGPGPHVIRARWLVDGCVVRKGTDKAVIERELIQSGPFSAQSFCAANTTGRLFAGTSNEIELVAPVEP